MGDIYMTKEMGAKVMKLMIVGMVAFLVLIIYVLWQSYEGRADLIKAERLECTKAQISQREASVVWRRQGEVVLANILEQRSKRDCNKAFSKAGFLP
jgi:uncharacterized membrane protein